jgi:hypothetical protein
MDIGKQQRVINVEPIAVPEPAVAEPQPQREAAEPAATRPARRHRPAARPPAHRKS